VLHPDEPSFAHNGRALERVTKLADVPRPLVLEGADGTTGRLRDSDVTAGY
jgi:hypothetical protein